MIRDKTAFKTSDPPRSLRITAENPNLQNTLSNRALAVVVAVLSGTGTDIKKLENGQTAVNMYLFPLLDVGKGPTKSIPSV